MLKNFIREIMKATIISVIVALFIVVILFGTVHVFAGAQIDEVVSIASKVAIIIPEKEVEAEPTVMTEKETLKNYPAYGTQYATIEIPKINVNLPVYFGDTLDILKNGVGHSSGSYFPGEGGSIIYMGHNSKKMFRRFAELQNGNEITVKANYGEYKYKIYDMKLIHETELDKVPVQKEKEILMIYTCYPFNNIGYTDKRYVVYAELEK